MKKTTLVFVVLFLVGILAGAGRQVKNGRPLPKKSYLTLMERNFLIIMKIAAISF